jgi:Tfp pilus assembly protein PilV
MNTLGLLPARIAGIATTLKRRLSRGVGLIDVLIAMLVLAGGAIGLAKLQSVSFREGTIARTNSIAQQLAQAKLDDLRSFTQLPAGGNGVFGYAEIGNNLGGAELDDGTLRLPSGAVTLSNETFQRTWTASPRYFCEGQTLQQTANCAPPKARPDAFVINVTVTFGGGTQPEQIINLAGYINNTDPTLVASALLSTSSEAPIVTYRPGAAPAVVAIDTGGGRKIETTNPTPSLVKRGSRVINTVARYETISYDTGNQTLRRREFTTLNCECRQLGTGTGEDRSGKRVSKRIGEPADQFQAFECGVCCRDHHDRSAECTIGTEAGRKGCYDPHRDSAYFMTDGSGDHKHFSATGVAADNVGDVYVEACRLERVDGFLRVAQDWKLATVNTIPENFFTSANVSSYGGYVKDYVQSLLGGTAPPAKLWSENETVPRNTTRQLLARGIYLDYLTSAEKSAFLARVQANDPLVFQEIPFYEVNLTKLAQWSPSDETFASVSNQPLVPEADGQNLYSRGLVTALRAGNINAIARVRLGNTGVINEFISTDPQENNEDQRPFVAINIPGASYTVGGTISGVTAGTAVTVTATGSGGNPSTVCTYAAGSFSCTLPQGWSGTLSASASGYSFSPGAIAISNLNASVGSQTFIGSAAAASYTVSGTINPAVVGVSVLGIGLPPSTDVTCTTTSVSYTCTVPANWSGTIQPSSSTHGFTPGNYSVTSIAGNQTHDFQATPIATGSTYTVSGIIATKPAQLQGTLTMVPSGAAGANCTGVAVNGGYTCTVPAGWTGALTPTVNTTTDPGITFVPMSRNFPSAISGNVSGQDFVTYYRISGSVSPASGTGTVTGVSFTATGNGSPNGVCGPYNDTNATYFCDVPGGWNGTIVPSKTSTTFVPTSTPYSNLTGPSTNQNYQAASAVTTYTIRVTVNSLKNNQTGVTVTPFTGLTCGPPSAATGSGSNLSVTIVCTANAGWNGTVSLSVPHPDPVSPSSVAYSNLGSNQEPTFTVQ